MSLREAARLTNFKEFPLKKIRNEWLSLDLRARMLLGRTSRARAISGPSRSCLEKLLSLSKLLLSKSKV